MKPKSVTYSGGNMWRVEWPNGMTTHTTMDPNVADAELGKMVWWAAFWTLLALAGGAMWWVTR